MKARYTLVLAALLLGLASADAALACSCAPQPEPQQALAGAGAVFTGTVVAVDTTQTNRQVRLRVEGSWKGARKEINCEEVTISTGLGDADCGFDFQVGTSYLVYADKAQGKLTTNICNRTKPTAQASEDLAALGEPKTTCGQG